MSSPLGRTVGNALEVRESIDVLKGGGPADVRETSLALAARMIVMAGLTADVPGALEAATSALDDGRALEVFSRFVAAQGGDARIVEDEGILPTAPVTVEVKAPSGGFVTAIDALDVGLAAMGLGAGRRTVDESVDPSVGIELTAHVGDEVEEGGVVALVSASDEASGRAAARRVVSAYSLGESVPPHPGRVLEVMEQPG
jgi:thymidine phosphorylase